MNKQVLNGKGSNNQSFTNQSFTNESYANENFNSEGGSEGTSEESMDRAREKSNPLVVTDLSDWIGLRREIKHSAFSVGFVPTMGALHPGHASLLQRARHENDLVVLSIYVNPTQFDNKEDLAKYPATLEKDLAVAAECGVDYVLLPTYSQLYPDDYCYKITEREFSKRLCGEHRPGHFDGVLTVVTKLLNLVQPQRAYFGEKDYQQLQLIRGMVAALFIDTEIVPCPTLREEDGLAMSSRNMRLTPEERVLAPRFSSALREGKDALDAKRKLEATGFEVDYVEDFGTRRYGAVKIGAVRLIDNVER
jgi:pantoate--beta-alanine ligase